MTNFTLTDDNVEAFWDAYCEGKTIWTIDLMAANPDIAEQARHGMYDVSVVQISFESRTLFVAHADDGCDRGLDPLYMNAEFDVCDTLAAARVAADNFIMEWKENWSF